MFNAERAYRIALWSVLLLQAGLLAFSAARHSPAGTEASHLVAGISHWHFGQFDLFRVNPPLVRLIATVPLKAHGEQIDWRFYDGAPGVRSEDAVARWTLTQQEYEALRWHRIARWMCIPLILLGGYVAWRWSGQLYGPVAAWTALVLWCFCPNVTGSGSLILPDVAAASFGLLAGYTFWRWLRTSRRWSTVVVAGLALGLAWLSKSTWGVLGAVWPLLWFIDRASRRPLPTFSCLWTEAVRLGVIVLVALAVLNAAYGFEGSFTRLGNYRFASQMLSGAQRPADGHYSEVEPGDLGNRFASGWLGHLPIPLPKNFVMGVDLQKWDFERPLAGTWRSYLAGQWQSSGWWYWYFCAMVVKVPLGTWLLLAVAFGSPQARPDRNCWRDELVILVPMMAVFVLVSSQTNFTNHVRYVFPAFGLLLVFASSAALAFRRSGWMKQVVAVGLTASVVSSLWIYPHHLSYFNELAGGPRHGHRYLLDSNIDCGQDLFYLRAAIARLDLEPHQVRLDYRPWVVTPLARDFASIDDAALLRRGNPSPGWYAISVNQLYEYDGRHRWFHDQTPIATAGYSIYIFHVPDERQTVEGSGIDEEP